MKWPVLRVLWGLLLVLAGIVFLLDSIGTISIGDYQWAIILVIGGLAFLSVFFADRQHWWALFPAFGLLIGGTILFFESSFPWISSDFGGAIALGGIGLAFLLIFLSNFKNWWALIPAGVLFSLAAMFVLGIESGGVFLIGLGLTFGVLGFIPTEHGRMRWAFIPAVVLILLGIFITLAVYNLFAVLWPLALIAAGVMIIYFVIKTRG
jgi:hypothetical protein